MVRYISLFLLLAGEKTVTASTNLIEEHILPITTLGSEVLQITVLVDTMLLT